METQKRIFYLIGFLLIITSRIAESQMGSGTGSISGTAKDKLTGEALPGVTVVIEGTIMGASADVDGKFTIANVKAGTYTVKATYISYDGELVNGVVVTPGKNSVVDIALSQSAFQLNDVMVTAERSTNTESSVISKIKMSPLISIGISGQQILRSQDRDASEVIRRFPGVLLLLS